MEIRVATEGDVPALCHVFRRSSWSNEGDRALLTERPEFLEWSGNPAREGRTLLAEIDGIVVGFVSTIDEGDSWEVEDLFVDPDWMRRGIARALIDSAADEARHAGVGRLTVDANVHALAFYEAAGFIADGEVPVDHGTAMRMNRPC